MSNNYSSRLSETEWKSNDEVLSKPVSAWQCLQAHSHLKRLRCAPSYPIGKHSCALLSQKVSALRPPSWTKSHREHCRVARRHPQETYSTFEALNDNKVQGQGSFPSSRIIHMKYVNLKLNHKGKQWGLSLWIIHQWASRSGWYNQRTRRGYRDRVLRLAAKIAQKEDEILSS